MIIGVTYADDVLKRLHEVQCEVLAAIDVACASAGLTYFIAYGSLLGAMRHGGFIPWDDDLDICMPYYDYLKFLDIATDILPEGYALHNARVTPGFSPLWTKVYKVGTRAISDLADEAGCQQGIFVDVFPLCRLDRRPRVREAQIRTASVMQKLSYVKHFKEPYLRGYRHKEAIKLLCGIAHETVAKPISQGRLVQNFEKTFIAAQPDDLWFSPANTREGHFKTNQLLPVVPIAFEGMPTYAPHDIHGFLTIKYGANYMELPPESERYCHVTKILDFGDGVNVMEKPETVRTVGRD